jgi:hypothetical protein
MGNILYLLFFAAFTTWMGVVLVHAVKSGEMWARGGNVYRSERPTAFWFSVSLAVVGLMLGFIMTTVMIVAISRG